MTETAHRSHAARAGLHTASGVSADAALAKALSAEHAAVYAYGVVGGRTTGRLRAQATAGFDAHRARRDQLRTLIAGRGGSPTEPGPTYQLPFEVRSTADAIRLAALIEQRLTTAYLELAAVPDPSLRRLAALAAQECATRAYGWQPMISAFPGLPGQPAVPGPGPTAPSPDPSSGPSARSGADDEPSSPSRRGRPD